MRTAEQYKQLGIPTWYHEHARYYERLFGNLGWNDKQITEALKFGATYQGDGSEADVSAKFKEFAAYIDAPDMDVSLDAALGLRDTISMEGLESLPDLGSASAPSFTASDEARLAEIRQTIRDDPTALDRLQDEQLALLEARQAAGGKVSASTAAASAPPAGDRLAQIREMRRNDPQAYDSDRALQAEELSLIEASLPTSAPVPTGSDGATPQGQTEGTPSGE
jgi:hypothetical protein